MATDATTHNQSLGDGRRSQILVRNLSNKDEPPVGWIMYIRSEVVQRGKTRLSITESFKHDPENYEKAMQIIGKALARTYIANLLKRTIARDEGSD